MSTETFSLMNTVGAIAARLGVASHRVEYVIKAKGIKHDGRAGIARVYSDGQVEQIAEELRKMDKRKEEAKL